MSAVGELKTKVKIVKVPKLWTVDQTLAFYRSLPNVAYAEPNAIADQHALATPNDYYYPQQWALARIKAFDGWAAYPGTWGPAGAPIAVIDTGVDGTHPDLAGQVQAGATCLTGVCVAGGGTIDDNGHGTVNAGAAAAAADNGQGVVGLAHGAPLIPIRALSAAGSGTYAGIAAAIIWAADHGARVINLSLGGTAPSQTLCGAVDYALGKGAFVAAASGNLGVDQPVYPAACDGAVGVGATDPSDAVPSWSDTGRKNVFVSAPGVLVHSTYPGNRYALATGTSVSTALVSGLASLLLAQDPGRTPADVRQILALTSDKVGSTSYGPDPNHTCDGCTWSTATGYGRIDVLRALTEAPASGSSQPADPVPPTEPVDPPTTTAPPAPAPASDFAVSTPPGAVTAAQGADASIPVSITAENGFEGEVALSVSGLPAGATAAFAPASVPASGSSTLTVSVADGTPVGSYTLVVLATGGTVTRTATATLVVTPAPAAAPPPGTATDFTLYATPPALIVRRGNFKTVTVKTFDGDGPVAGPTLSASGLPEGVTATFTPTASGHWTLRLDAAADAPRFVTTRATISATLGATTRTVSLVITVM